VKVALIIVATIIGLLVLVWLVLLIIVALSPNLG
jgi:hypothetical protein